jgi:hypothetical protein
MILDSSRLNIALFDGEVFSKLIKLIVSPAPAILWRRGRI